MVVRPVPGDLCACGWVGGVQVPLPRPSLQEDKECQVSDSNAGNAFRGMVYALAFSFPFWALFTLPVWWVF
jgi:hypothetical protein